MSDVLQMSNTTAEVATVGQFWPKGGLWSKPSPPILALEGESEFPITRTFEDGEGPTMSANSISEPEQSKLLELPNEILSHIFTFLDNPPPSIQNIVDHPVPGWTSSDLHPLKDISLLSQRLRPLVLPRLFRHARLDPYHLTLFLEFVNRRKLSLWITSIVAHLQGPCNHIHPAWWCRLLNSVPATSFSIGCAPHVFAEIARISISCTDSWAFRMPYHFLSLQQTPEAARMQISYTDLPNILVARPWTSLTVNEGSSLAAYTQYEYFLKKPPSLLAALQLPLSLSGITNLQTQDLPSHHQSHSGPSTSSTQYPAAQLFSTLQSFSFVAIFPFYNHVDSILKCVRLMRSLRTLFIKLCPEPDSTILDDEMRESRNHIDLNDPWTEFNTAYNLISHTVNFLTVEGRLEAVKVDDVKMEGIRDTLEESLNRRLHKSWHYHGNGLWRRTTTPVGTDDDAADHSAGEVQNA